MLDFFMFGRSRLALVAAAMMVALYVSAYAGGAAAQSSKASLEQQIATLKKQLGETRRIAKSSLTRAIETTDEIVSGLSKRLSAADNVPPETVANILDLALQIYTQAAQDIEGSALLGKAGLLQVDLLQKLIEVDIQTSIARTRMALGNLATARKSLEVAERRRDKICGDNASPDCDLRAIRIAEAIAELALNERPLTRAHLAEAYRQADTGAIQLGISLGLDKLKLNKGRAFTSGREHDLFLAFWLAETTQARLLLQLAQLDDVGIEPAQRRELLRVAEGRISRCNHALKPPRSAREGNIDNLLGTKPKQDRTPAPGTVKRDADGEVRAGCLLVASQVKNAQSGHERGDQARKLERQARDLVDSARTTISGMSAEGQRKLPLQRLSMLARIEQGLLRRNISGNERLALVQSVRDFTALVTRKDFRNATLEQHYLDLVDRIRVRMKASNDALGLPVKERILILTTSVSILVNRIRRLGEGVSGTRRDSELRDLQSTLAANSEQLFAVLSSDRNPGEIARAYEAIQSHLPSLDAGNSASDDVFSNLLRIKYAAGRAFRALGSEADAIETFYNVETSASKRLRGNERTSVGGSVQMRLIHAYATRALGDISVEDIAEGQKRDRSLKLAFERVNAAQGSDASNIEFKFALASVLYNQASRLLDRGETDKASELLERARRLGSDKAAKLLIAWARNGTGPTGRIDRERAERFSREWRENTPLEYTVRATSEFPAEKSFKIFVTQFRDGIEPIIDKEIKRLKDYYGVIKVDETDLARLRDIFQNARRSAGDGAIITRRDMLVATDRVRREINATRPYGLGPLAEALAKTDTLIEDEDYGRARDTLDRASRQLSVQVKSAADVEKWGFLALHYLKLAQANRAAVGDKRSPELIQRVKESSQRALTRTTDLRLLRGQTLLPARHELFKTFRRLAARADGMQRQLRRSLSYETNKSYPLRLNELARQFQALAIAEHADGPRIANPKREDIEEMIAARMSMANYARRGARAMEASNESLQSVKTRLFTQAMRQLSTSQSLVEGLEKRFPDLNPRYPIRRLNIQLAVAQVHDSFEEPKVALRLALETIEDTEKLVASNRDDLVLRVTEGHNHELIAGIALRLAERNFKEMVAILTQLGRISEQGLIGKLQDPKSDIPAFVRTKYRSAGERFDLAREHFSKAVEVRERILAVDPDAFCACKVNNNVRLLARTAKFQKQFKYPRRAGMPDIEKYLKDRIAQWNKRASEDRNPDSTRFAHWYLARAYALQDDLIRNAVAGSDGRERYADADEAFRKIASPNNEMRADHALLLSDKAYYQLTRGFVGLPEAERAVKESYEIWLRLPYSVWIEIEQSDLNIPANYAHVQNVKSITNVDDRNRFFKVARDIYKKYEGYRLEAGKEATWTNLIEADIEGLRTTVQGYEPLVNPLFGTGR